MDLKFIFILLFCEICAAVKRYDNFTLYRGLPINEEHLGFFRNLSKKYDVNFWKSPGLVNMSVDFTINPKDSTAFVAEAEKKNIYLTTLLKNVQSAFDNQTVRKYIRRNMNSFNWMSYYRLHDINTWLADLHESRPNEIELFSIGKSIEGRSIIGVKIALEGCKRRSKVIIEAGIHAREWIAPAVATYVIHQLVNPASEELKMIAQTYEWYILPVLNPDGYEYTHTHDRQWRKNRRKGYGVDVNRNFGIAFGTVGVSKNKKSEEYNGRRPFSEPESRAMAQFVKKHRGKLEYYMGFHSYGLLFIIPYAFTTKHYDNYDEMHNIAKKVREKIAKRYGTTYKIGSAFDTVGYMASGVSSDWAKNIAKIPYVATMELRDAGDYGFALPPNQIMPTCEETMDGLIELFRPKTKKLQILSEVGEKEPDGQVAIVVNGFLVLCNILLLMVLNFK